MARPRGDLDASVPGADAIAESQLRRALAVRTVPGHGQEASRRALLILEDHFLPCMSYIFPPPRRFFFTF